MAASMVSGFAVSTVLAWKYQWNGHKNIYLALLSLHGKDLCNLLDTEVVDGG